jgi:hypothetical protein
MSLHTLAFKDDGKMPKLLLEESTTTMNFEEAGMEGWEKKKRKKDVNYILIAKFQRGK